MRGCRLYNTAFHCLQQVSKHCVMLEHEKNRMWESLLADKVKSVVHAECGRQGSLGEAAGDALGSKEPSSLLSHNKLRSTQSERELPSLIPSHPEGGNHNCVTFYTP